MIKAIIFDYDGVLVDSVNVGFEAYKQIGEFLTSKGMNACKMRTLEDFQIAQRKGYRSLLKDWGISNPFIIEQTKKIYRDKNKELKEERDYIRKNCNLFLALMIS